jgi:hypothetical protein
LGYVRKADREKAQEEESHHAVKGKRLKDFTRSWEKDPREQRGVNDEEQNQVSNPEHGKAYLRLIFRVPYFDFTKSSRGPAPQNALLWSELSFLLKR